MPSRSSSGRPSLTYQLDKDVYQIVQKMVEDEGNIPRVSEVYQKIKTLNSGLNRRPKKILESSIERVINVLRADQADSDSASIEDELAPKEDDLVASNAMNRSITQLWSKSEPTTATNGTSGTQVSLNSSLVETKSRKRQANEVYPRKRTRIISHQPPSGISVADIGGLDPVVRQLTKLVAMPLLYPNLYTNKGIQPPRGILLYGPPGCGKTMIVNAIAAGLNVPFISISAPSVVSGMSGESEKALRDYFDEAKKIAPCLMFIDEIDAITPKREDAQREMEKRIVAQLLTCMDDLAPEKTGGRHVIVMAATNRPDSLDPALRRGGRFDKEIAMSIPTESMRGEILRALTGKLKLADDIEFAKLAQRTPGFVGADLQDLVSTAGAMSIERDFEILKNELKNVEMDLDNKNLRPAIREFLNIVAGSKLQAANPSVTPVTNNDFFEALPRIQPSLKREGFSTVPDTTWADIGALEDIRKELDAVIINPILHPEKYARVGITTPSGVLLYGPPGCGKTLLARAVANESKANFISIKGPELLNKFVGESERAVRQVFDRARASAPCVVFFDELDSLASKRDDGLGGSSARVVNTLLTELDGLDQRVGVYVLAATNRLDIIDPAMTRPGRLDVSLYVGLPSEAERVLILQTLLRRVNVSFDSTIQKVAESCDGFSGADLAALVKHAGLQAINRDDRLRAEDFVWAKEKVRSSVRQ